MRVLVVNAGSSSLKLTLLDADDRTLARREIDGLDGRVDETELAAALHDGLAAADVVGHRIVHGGERFQTATRLDAGVEADLRALADLAPLHQPKSLAALDAVSALLPGLPAVVCFDTAFHATLPAAAATYALPAALARTLGDPPVMGFTGSRTRGSPGALPSCSAGPGRDCGWSAATSAPAPRCARSPTAARSTRRWASRRSRGW